MRSLGLDLAYGAALRQHLRTIALLALTAAAVLLVGIPITATAKPPQPTPAYTLGQEIVTASGTPNTNGPTVITVTCPGSKVVTGGGYSADEQIPVSTNAPLAPNQCGRLPPSRSRATPEARSPRTRSA